MGRVVSHRRFALFLIVGLMLLAGACTPRTGAPAPSRAESVADFYQGKTITVIVSFAPGGGYDTTARILANHMGKHIPGNPGLIVENMDGAGSLIGANHLFNVAKPDGLTFGTFNEGVEPDERILGRFPNAVRAVDIAPDDQARQLIGSGMAGGAVAKPFVLPPGVPAARLKALQDAFAVTMQDPDFRADMDGARLEVNANPAARSEEIVNGVLNLTPELATRLADIRK